MVSPFYVIMISQITKIINVFRRRSASTKVYQTDHSPLVASVSELELGVRSRVLHLRLDRFS